MKVRLRTRQLAVSLGSLLLFLGVIGSLQSLMLAHTPVHSSEVGFVSLSPRGAEGGVIVPASCESGYEHNAGTGMCSAICAVSPTNPKVGDTVTWTVTNPYSLQGINAGIYHIDAEPYYRTYETNVYGSSGTQNKVISVYSLGGSDVIGMETCSVYVSPACAAGYGSACASSPNSCGQTQSNGTIQCDGSCSSTPPSDSSCVAPTASISQSVSTADSGTTFTVSWSSTNATSCTVTRVRPDGLVTNPWAAGTSGSLPATPTYPGTYTWSNTCTGPGGTSNTATISHVVTCPSGTEPSADGTGCVQIPVSLADLTAGDTTISPTSVVAGQSESFSATVSNIGDGSASNFPNIFQVANSAKTVTIAMVNANTVSSLSSGASTGLSGSYTFTAAGTYNVRACADNNSSWAGSIDESNEGNNCGAWKVVTVLCVANQGAVCSSAANSCGQTNTGTVQCDSSCSAAVPSNSTCPPTVTLSASPNPINQGQSTKLFWSSTNATSCTSAGGFSTGGATTNPPGGVSTGVLLQDSTYQITCSNASGTSAPAQVTVTVIQPEVNIGAEPPRVTVSGGSSILSWSSVLMSSCNVTGPNGFSQSSISGSATIIVTGQATYSISCTPTGGGAAIVRQVTVNVEPFFQEF